MTRMADEVRIEAPREAVWRLLADLGGIHKIHSGLRDSRLLGEQREGVGASRRCDLKPGGHLDERVTEWRPGEALALEVTGGRGIPPFQEAGARFTLRDAAGGSTLVSLELRYELRFGWLGRLLDRLAVRRQFEKTVTVILRGLKARAEAGREPAAA